MDKSKILSMGLGFGCLLLGAFGGWTFYQGMGLRADLAAKQSALDQAQAQVRALEAKLKKSEEVATKAKAELEAIAKEDAAAPTTAEASGAEAPASAPAATDPEVAKAEARKKAAAMMNGPFGAMVAKQTIDMMYGDLLNEMVLTPQEKEQLTKTLVENQLAMMRSASDGKDPAQAGKDYQARDKATEEKIKSMIGDERFKQYQTYKKQISDRFSVRQFESQMSLTSNPLAAPQKAQLIQVMSQEREKLMQELAGPEAPLKMGTAEYQKELNQRINNRLGTVLMPEQLKEFVKWQDSMANVFAPPPKSTNPAK